MLTQDPRLIIKQLLVDNWVATNTSNVTPRFHTGWFNDNWMDVAQCTIIAQPETPLSAGATGYYGFKGTPGGVRLMLGDMMVGVWAHHDLPYSVNPKQLTFEMSEEVKRVIDANVTSVSDFEWMTYVGKYPVTDSNTTPILFRYNCSIRYMYRD